MTARPYITLIGLAMIGLAFGHVCQTQLHRLADGPPAPYVRCTVAQGGVTRTLDAFPDDTGRTAQEACDALAKQLTQQGTPTVVVGAGRTWG